MSNQNAGEVSVRPKQRLGKKKQEIVGEPLDKKSLRFFDRDGNIRQCSAVDVRFSCPMVFVKFDPPPHSNSDGKVVGDVSQWLRSTQLFESNLRALLRLPHHRFWATVMREEGVHIMLESYLNNTPRFYAINPASFSDQVKHAIASVHGLVIKVFLRMSTVIESKVDHMSSHFFGNTLYSKFIFDVPKLIDICTVYGNAHPTVRAMITQMVEVVLKCNPKYNHDVNEALNGFIAVFEDIKANLGLGGMSGSRMNLDFTSLCNAVHIITDTSVALSSFLVAYPTIANQCHELGFEGVIASFYETVFPPLQDELQKRFETIHDEQSVSLIRRQVTTARARLIKAFRDIVTLAIIEPHFDNGIDMNAKHMLSDTLFDVLTLALSEKSFARDYVGKFPPADDINRLKADSRTTGFDESVDQTRIDYLLKENPVVQRQVDAQVQRIHNDLKSNGINNSVTNGMSKVNNSTAFEDPLPSSLTNAGGGIGEVELQSLISNIKDMLPELGEGFIEACLSEFKYDTERTIDVILNDALPPNISNLNRDMTREFYARSMVKHALPGVLASRRNIHDGDEFDIFRRNDIDVSRIHRGKRNYNEGIVKKVDNETKAAILRLDEMKLQEEADEEERAYRDACQQALDEEDARKRAIEQNEYRNYEQQEREKKAAKAAEEAATTGAPSNKSGQQHGNKKRGGGSQGGGSAGRGRGRQGFHDNAGHGASRGRGGGGGAKR